MPETPAFQQMLRVTYPRASLLSLPSAEPSHQAASIQPPFGEASGRTPSDEGGWSADEAAVVRWGPAPR